MNFWRKLKMRRFLRTDAEFLAYMDWFFPIQQRRRHKLPGICLQHNGTSLLRTSHSILHYKSAFLDLAKFFQGRRSWNSVIAPKFVNKEKITAFCCFFPGFFSGLTAMLLTQCQPCQLVVCTLKNQMFKHQQRQAGTTTSEWTHIFEHVIRILCNVGSPRRHVLDLCGWDLSCLSLKVSLSFGRWIYHLSLQLLPCLEVPEKPVGLFSLHSHYKFCSVNHGITG